LLERWRFVAGTTQMWRARLDSIFKQHITHLRIPAARYARVAAKKILAAQQRAWGMPGAQRTRSPLCNKKAQG
jgi:hypothetical protein